MSGISSLLPRVWSWPVVLCVLSGAAALAHQVLWTRRMIDLLGGSAEASARVLGCFFLGLAIGAALGGWLAPKVRRPWRWIGLAEGGIILLVLPLLFLPTWSGNLWPWLGAERLTGLPGSALKTVLSFLLVTPPAVLMGVFIPLLARAVLRGDRRLGREGIGLYAANTLGGVAGLLLVVLVFLRLGGAEGAFLATMGLNLVVASLCFRMDWHSPLLPVVEETGVPQASSFPSEGMGSSSSFWGICLGMAFFSGMAVLAAEVAALQMMQLVTPLSFHAPAALLSSVIAMLGLAAWAAPRLFDRFGALEDLLPKLCTLAGIATVCAGPLFAIIVARGLGTEPASSLLGFTVLFWVVSWLSTGPAFFVAGLVLPALFRVLDEKIRDRKGKLWGWLLAVNGVGGLAGTELAYRVLLPHFGLYVSLGIIGVLYMLAGLALHWAWHRPGLHLHVPAMVLSALALLFWLPNLPTINPHLPVQVLYRENSREGSIAVIEGSGPGRAILHFNQYMLGSTSARFEQERLGHLPLLLHPSPRAVAYLGLATGITPSASLHHTAVEQVDVVEIAEVMVRISGHWFSTENNSFANDPKVRLVVEDARTWIAAREEAYDVIIGDLYLPWGPGEARLYSREHFTAVRRALRDGGLFAQWLPFHQLTESQLAMIMRTFTEVFGESWMMAGGFQSHAPSVALVAWNGTSPDIPETIAARIREEEPRLRDPHLRHPELVSMFFLGRPDPSSLQHHPIHTLNNLRLEIAAGQTRIRTGGTGDAYLAGQSWQRFLEDSTLIHWGELMTGSDTRENWKLLGRDLQILNVLHTSDPALARRSWRDVASRLPPGLWRDRWADWERWSGVRGLE